MEDLTTLARRLLDAAPDPAPRYLILRDLLRCDPESALLQEAKDCLSASRHIQALAGAQQSDGGWGRFHSQDSRVKSPFPTSEYAIRRALALGLDSGSPVLQKTMAFIQAHLKGETAWPDPVEKHDDPRVFPFNIRSVSAAILALIDPGHPMLESFWQHWAQILEAAFASGSYDPRAELAMHQALSGIPSPKLYHFHDFYPLIILSATRRRLAPELEARMLGFLLHKPGGIYYICSRSLDQLPALDEKEFLPWLHGQEILARFPGWKPVAVPLLNGLWSQRDSTGFWRIGNPASGTYDLPLSESWRKPGSRELDSSVKILSLLQRFFL